MLWASPRATREGSANKQRVQVGRGGWWAQTTRWAPLAKSTARLLLTKRRQAFTWSQQSLAELIPKVSEAYLDKEEMEQLRVADAGSSHGALQAPLESRDDRWEFQMEHDGLPYS